MAYDPVTGEYKEDDESVSTRLTGLLSKDSKYLQQAETTGKQAANRRGLLNSSLGVQAAEAARISAALPIASQEASQAHETNLMGRSTQFQDISQQRDISSAKERLGLQLTSQEKLATQDIQSREKMQAADIEAMNSRLEAELGSRAALQAAQLAAEKEQLGLQLTSQERRAADELAAAQARLSQELQSRQTMQGLDLEVQQRIAQMNLGANERAAAAQLAQGFEATYSNTVAAIMSNPDIPAAERQRYLDHAAQVRDSNLNMLEQLFDIDLQWETAAGGSAPLLPNGQPSSPPNNRRDLVRQ